MNIGFMIFLIGIIIFLIGIIGSKINFLKKIKFYLISISVLAFIISLSSLLFLHIIPYTQNVFDTYKVEALEKDINYYNDKIKQYEEEDKKVLEEWARQQEKMAEKLSSIGVQFAGEIQPNNIIKKLSGKIQEFHNEINEINLQIHKLEGNIKARKYHKWYWGF